MREEDTFLYGFADFANTCIAWMGHRCDPPFHDWIRDPAPRSGAYNDLASAMACCFTSQNESKTLLLGSVTILFLHRIFATMVWTSTRLH